MRVIFDNVSNLHRNNVQLRIALAVARLNATEAQPLHVHAFAACDIGGRQKSQPAIFGGELNRENSPFAEAVGAYIEVGEHRARVHSSLGIWHN